MKKILVTGGAGFIGGHFIPFLDKHREDISIYNMDVLTYAGDLDKHKNITKQNNYTFLPINITDHKSVHDVFAEERFDIVIHFAAETHVDRSIASPSPFISTNVMGTNVLLEAAYKYEVEKFIYISTDEVYGDVAFDSSELFIETSPLHPNNPYSASKASADLLVQAFYHTYGLPVSIIRCTNNYGPYQHREKLIPTTILSALRDEPIPVYGTGHHLRDWLYVEDHCQAIMTVLDQGENGEIYNVSANQEKHNLDVVQNILGLLDKPSDLITFVADRFGHDKRYPVDSSKIRQLGWKPRYDFVTGLNKTLAWYRSQF
ncbi:dTDP-glucose 4,6-dehydratase [Paraliobacillus ryukyuensis]|uniref:dTDP-glucose 4,6-dehydratase n=1 Tax=Paraliobacillus ryukyuensis TaxID=200904 RepID=UPI0009A8F857|nr:dTDP-glucose 4,6-dehydratase [Paraliobacillus ryukyuensis]